MENQKRNIELGKLLNLEIMSNAPQGCSYRLNKYQTLAIYWHYNGKKASANIGVYVVGEGKKSLSLWDLSLDPHNCYKEIGFSVNKVNHAIVKDIEKRLLNTDFCKEALNIIKAKHEIFLKNTLETQRRSNFLKDLSSNTYFCKNSEKVEIHETELDEYVETFLNSKKITVRCSSEENYKKLMEFIVKLEGL